MVTDADRLAAAGAELTIAGHLLHVRYTPRSLKLMEDKTGSLQKIGELLTEVNTGKAPLVSTVFWILSLGLRHEALEDGTWITEDWLLDNGDSRELAHYAEVAFTALVEALPGTAVRAAESEDGADPLAASPGASNGLSSSGSASPISTSAPASSGTA